VAIFARAAVWVYTGEAGIGVLMALVALGDGLANLRVAWPVPTLRSTALLWVGLAITALISQAKLAVLGLIVVSAPIRPVRGYTLPLTIGFILAAAIVLCIQVAMVVGRASLRRHKS
jgi:hypothetical protein